MALAPVSRTIRSRLHSPGDPNHTLTHIFRWRPESVRPSGIGSALERSMLQRDTLIDVHLHSMSPEVAHKLNLM